MKGESVLPLILLLLEPTGVLLLLVACVFVGMFLALLVWDRLFTHEEKRADQLVTEAERGPSNVLYLAEWIQDDHRRQRLRRLLERES